MLRCRKLNITLISAEDLPNVRKNGPMEVYAKVSINGKKTTKKYTGVDKEGETNPVWNFCVDYTIDEAAVRSEEVGLEVVVKLYCERLFGDRYIGEVRIAMKSLFDNSRGVIGSRIAVSYGVGGTRQGRLNIIYSFGEMFLVPRPPGWKEKHMGKAAFGMLARAAAYLLTGDIGDWWGYLNGA